MDVAQVEIRLGETTLDRAYIAAGERFWIGSLPGAQLAVAGIGLFPLVTGTSDGFTIRAPVGTALAIDGRASTAEELRLERDRVITIAFALARVEIQLVTLQPAAVPRPPYDVRPAAYTMVSLLAHLSVWAAAIELAPDVVFNPGVHHRMSLGSHRRFAPPAGAQAPQVLAHIDVTGPPEAAPSVAAAIAPSNAAVTTATRAGSHARNAPTTPDPTETSDAGQAMSSSVAAAVGDYVRSFDAINIAGALEQVGPLYRPDEASGFGTSRAFDPTGRADYKTIAAGPLAPFARGDTGEGYDVGRDVELCAPPGCAISGPLSEAQLRHAVEPALWHLASCHGSHHGDVVLDLTIDTHGNVTEIRSGGLGDVAPCAAKVVASIQFPVADVATVARFPLHYYY